LPLAADGSGALSREIVRQAFENFYAGAYGRLLPAVPVRVLNLRSTAIGARPKIDLLSMAPEPGISVAQARIGARKIWFGGWQEAAVYDRLALPVGAEIAGPAVLEQPDTTILIEPGQRGTVDRFGNLLIEAAA
jgi:N-methylhydantoinase A